MNEPLEQRSPATPDPGFAPKDITDGRPGGEWASRYAPEAWSFIWQETRYLALHLITVMFFIGAVWLKWPHRLLGVPDQDSFTFSQYTLALLGGMLGGVLFAMKWLYHSVAKHIWNLDRRVWRFLTPYISGCLAFASIAIIDSFGVFNQSLLLSRGRSFAFGFLVGFFSDNAAAKLAEVAETLFGPTPRMGDHVSKVPRGKRNQGDEPS